MAPATAWAGEDEDEPFASFAVKASNGYRIVVLAAGADSGERGEAILLVLHRSGERAVYYRTTATLTQTALVADFGSLGRIDLVLARTGRERLRRIRCGGRFKVETGTYFGTFEFRGERGFTSARASRIPYEPAHFINLAFCEREVDIDVAGPEQPGPGGLLRAFAKPDKRSSLSLEAVKSRPEGRALVRAVLRERRRGVGIVRGIGMRLGASSFRYDRGLGAATVDPPAPFSGAARFRRDAATAGRWTGNLRVDFPGRPNVSLTRSELRPKLRRGSWAVSDSAFERPALRPLTLFEAGATRP